MKRRLLGRTGLEVPILAFGASSLGAEFRRVTVEEALASVHVALDLGMNLIDTSPFYGRGMSEVLLGIALKEVPRDSYTLCTKLGRYDLGHFDFSAKRVAESVDVSLHRLGTDHLDIILCHDIEFVPMEKIVDETIPALEKIRDAGKVRFIGFSGYPQKIFRFICDQADVDCVLNYNQYTLQNTRFADGAVARGARDRRHERRAVQRPAPHRCDVACLAQGAGEREGGGAEGGGGLSGPGDADRQARAPVLPGKPADRDDDRGQRQSGQHPRLGNLGGRAARP